MEAAALGQDSNVLHRSKALALGQLMLEGREGGDKELASRCALLEEELAAIKQMEVPRNNYAKVARKETRGCTSQCEAMVQLMQSRPDDKDVTIRSTERVQEWCDRELQEAAAELSSAQELVAEAKARIANAEQQQRELAKVLAKLVRWGNQKPGTVELRAPEVSWLACAPHQRTGVTAN